MSSSSVGKANRPAKKTIEELKTTAAFHRPKTTGESPNTTIRSTPHANQKQNDLILQQAIIDDAAVF